MTEIVKKHIQDASKSTFENIKQQKSHRIKILIIKNNHNLLLLIINRMHDIYFKT